MYCDILHREYISFVTSHFCYNDLCCYNCYCYYNDDFCYHHDDNFCEDHCQHRDLDGHADNTGIVLSPISRRYRCTALMQIMNEVARCCACPYGDAKDGYLWWTMMYGIHQDSSPINFKYIKHNCTGVYGILVSWTVCRMYLYAQKARLNYRDVMSLN